jgi:hypothetical protein
VVYFHSFLPVNSQMTTNITAITSSICINEPKNPPKKPSAQSITIIMASANHIFIANSPFFISQHLFLSLFLIGLGAPDAMARRRTVSSNQTISGEKTNNIDISDKTIKLPMQEFLENYSNKGTVQGFRSGLVLFIEFFGKPIEPILEDLYCQQ